MFPDPVRKYLKTIENIEIKTYIKDIFSEITKKGKKVAYHALCADGAISASILKYLGWGDIFIPLDYDVLKNDVLRPYLTSVDWFIIIDLEPFAENTLDLWVDHHRSVIGSKINAKRIAFEVGEYGPSAAFVLYNYAKSKQNIPEFIAELAEISKVTDTASFKIDPPTEKIDLNNTKEILTNFDKLCWFVVDATNIEDSFSLQANNELVNLLATNGVNSLINQEIIDRVNRHRDKRILAENYIKTLTISSLMVIINGPNQIFKQYVALRLGNLGTKVIAFFTEKKNLISISLRQSKKNSSDEIANFRLDILAKLFNQSGGGHAEASGSASESLEKALGVITKWGSEKGLELTVNYYN